MKTVKDVAKLANVSTATVSRVLSGYPHVRAKTRERVLHAVKELDYRPDQIARSLRRRQTHLFALVVSTIENVFFMEVAVAAEQVARDYGYNLIICNTNEDPEREAAYLKVLDQQMIAGIILAPAPGDARHLTTYLEHRLPIVLINRRIEYLPYTSITSDDEDAAFQCVQHLIDEGRRRIAAITGLPGVYTTQTRLHGYHRALASAGLSSMETLEICGWAHLEGGYTAARTLLERADPPDALFVFNNLMIQGVIAALQALGVTWPEQIDVAGFGTFSAAHLYRPPLTLIAQPAREMGRQAVEILLAQIEKGRRDRPEQIVLRNRLIPRREWLTPSTVD